jgi:hypothetical protein
MPTLEAIDGGIGNGPQSSVGSTLPPGAAEKEWFLAGDATRYGFDGEYTLDGRWHVKPAGTAAYRSRLFVLRPAPDRFNGTVIVVWNNVSSGVDGVYAGPDLATTVADGFAVVGVSAQHVGIDGPLGLVATDPDRYASLHHPGDDYSYDIFVQAARLAAAGDGELLGDLQVRHVVAAGASQSACRLATLHNALHPSDVVDAYVLVVYAGNGTSIDTSTPAAGFDEVPDNSTVNILPFRTHRLRDDLDVPVLVVNSETEACLFTANRQPDSDHLRIWESAGTSHVGLTTMELPDMGNGAPCRGSFAPAMRAAYHHLQRWLDDGTPPPGQPRIERSDDGTAARDEHGNALGGIRWPHLEAPLGTHRGEAVAGPIDLMGATIPFDREKVHALYGSRADYDARFAAAVAALVETGVVLPDDAASVRDTLTATAWDGSDGSVDESG